MNIFDARISGSLEVTGNSHISGNLTIDGNISGNTTNAITASYAETAPNYTLTSSFNYFTSSYRTGSFTGSFIGDGSQLTNISSTGVNGLFLYKITSGSVSASIDPDKGFQINTDTSITGSIVSTVTPLVSGSAQITYSYITGIPSGIISGSDQITSQGYATTGSNNFQGTQTITGSLYISSDLVVQGSSSLQNITASAVNIGANIVNLNTANPAIRFAGLNIFDSGSIGGSGSFLYDAVQDEFVFVHRGDGTNVTSSVVLMGPQTYNNVGSEIYPTTNRLLKGVGNEHIGDSIVTETGGGIGISGSLSVTGSVTTITNLRVNSTGSAGSSFSAVLINSPVVTWNVVNDDNGGGGDLRFYNDSIASDAIRIKRSNNNVGIGTNNPTGTYGKLSVAGGIDILSDNNAKLEIGRYSSGASNSYIKLGANSNSLRITNNIDTIDVFTFTNTGVLDINGDNAISSINDKFALGVSGTSHAWIQSFGGRPLVLQGSGNNVGIGTTNPVTNLQLGRVFGFVQDINSGYIQANMASNGNYIISQFANRIHLDSAIGEINFLNAVSGTAGAAVSLVNRMKIASDGKIGIGTGTSAPPEPLSVSFAAHGLISQHRQSSGVGVGQNFFMKFNNADGSAVSYAGIYADIQSNTTGAHRGRMLLQTANAGSLASVLSLTSSGVQFGGTGSNLNNYEEGTWTPSIVGGGGGESTYSSHRAGWYTRVGRLVTVTWFVVITKNNMSGTLRMSGLPFTLINGSGVFYPQGTVLLDSLSTTTNNITFQAANNSNSGDFIAGNGSTVTHTGLPISALGTGTMECRGTVTYFTS